MSGMSEASPRLSAHPARSPSMSLLVSRLSLPSPSLILLGEMGSERKPAASDN